MKMIAVLLLSGILNCISAQNIPPELFYYTSDHEAYEGDEESFYQDFHQILAEEKIQPCENKMELYLLKVIVYEDGSIKYLQDDSNSKMAESSKCAFDMSVKVLGFMNKWKPLQIDGQKKQGVIGFYIFPNALFENYEPGYSLNSASKQLKRVPGGVNSFRNKVVERIRTDGFQWKKSFKLVVFFTVNTDGVIEDIMLENSSGLPDFDKRIIRGIKSIKKKWTPATIHGVPVKYRFQLPLSFGEPK